MGEGKNRNVEIGSEILMCCTDKQERYEGEKLYFKNDFFFTFPYVKNKTLTYNLKYLIGFFYF